MNCRSGNILIFIVVLSFYQALSAEVKELEVSPVISGKTMKYVGYNQGYYLPGSNKSDWLRYSNVNSLRLWTALNEYVPVEYIVGADEVESLAQFEQAKALVRQRPEKCRQLKWDSISRRCESVVAGTNTMQLSYALQETKRLDIDVVLQINNRDFDSSWSVKFRQWLRFYALAYYAARTGDVGMYAMQNEPNHHASGPMKIDEYIAGLQVVSDAIKCAVEDVNRKYGKSIEPRIVAPVTAGANMDWWIKVMQEIESNYTGVSIGKDLFDIFSTHAYNLPASGYKTKVTEIRNLLSEHHPKQKALPIVFTETGRWMNSRLIDKYETMDSPSLFTEWAGEYVNNTLNGCYGMWAFKIANTKSGTYPRGIKSGHHFTWQGQRIVEDAYVNLALNKRVYVVSDTERLPLRGVCDGDKRDTSAWISPVTYSDKIIEIDLEQKQLVAGAVVYTGSAYGVYTGPDRVKNFKFQYLLNNQWIDIEETIQQNAKYVQSFFVFTTSVLTDKIRFIAADTGSIKIREIKLFDRKSMESIQSSYNISGIHRTGEVVRLFAKGFKNERPLLQTTITSAPDANFDAITSYDSLSNRYYIWLVQRGLDAETVMLDLSKLNLPASSRVIAEEVSAANYGNVTFVRPLGISARFSMSMPAQSVVLLTIPVGGASNYEEHVPIQDAMVVAGRNSTRNYGKDYEIKVEMNAAQADNNSVGYIQFRIDGIDKKTLNAAILKVRARSSAGLPMRIHVYADVKSAWNEMRITRSNAPCISDTEVCSWVTTGPATFLAGEMVANGALNECALDVTDIVKNTLAQEITFVFIRELREMGDDIDKDNQFSISSKETPDTPVLITW